MKHDFVALHNARLIDVRPTDDSHVLLTIEQAGVTRELIGPGPWSEEFSRHDVGKFGYVVPARRLSFDDKKPEGACYFYSYIDQSLCRAPELDCIDRLADDAGRKPKVIGWRCDARPNGFRAPVGVIPGEGGRFVDDETEPVTLRVPPEFVRECLRVQMTPYELLRSFVGDVAGINSYVTCPRADGYGSNGSDERDYADAWLQRAHGMQAIDLDELDARNEEAQEKRCQRDDFTALLDDYECYGGNADDLLAAVQALVDKRQAEALREDDGEPGL